MVEFATAVALQAKLVVNFALRQQVTHLQDTVEFVLLQAAAASVWLQPQAAGEVH
jgi:hypothetical protein